MGFFSWKTSDTDQSIANIFSSRDSFPVYVLIPEEFGGGYIEEKSYGGYGEFGGHDIYALIAKWNKPELCNGDVSHDRIVGINIGCGDELNFTLKYPIKITSKPLPYHLAEPSHDCEFQGYFYDDEDLEEDDDWIEEEYELYEDNHSELPWDYSKHFD